MTFIKWYSRIALALGIVFTVPYVVFAFETAAPRLNGIGMTSEGLGAFVTLVVSGLLLAQALVVTLQFAARVWARCAPGSVLRLELRWHVTALAPVVAGYFIPMTFRSIWQWNAGVSPQSQHIPHGPQGMPVAIEDMRQKSPGMRLATTTSMAAGYSATGVLHRPRRS